MPESPRWHDNRLWFSNWGTRQIVAVDLDGNGDVVGEGPDGLGWATNWLPDGRLLITGPELIRVEGEGSRVRHADLRHISPHGWSEITVGCSTTAGSHTSTPLSSSRITQPTNWGAIQPASSPGITITPAYGKRPESSPCCAHAERSLGDGMDLATDGCANLRI
jgi:hypothetical protein